MKNNILTILIICLSVASCDVSKTRLKQSIKYGNGQLSININSPKEHRVICKYFDEIFIDTLFKKSINFDLEDTLSTVYNFSNSKSYEIAYSLITKGYVPIYVNIDEKVDTMFVGHIDLAAENNLYAKVVSGEVCPIERYYLSEQEQYNIRRWLDEDKLVSAIDMGKMLTRMNPLDYIPSNVEDYYTGKNIPILKSFTGQKYSLESNLKADNYYLYAPIDISDLNGFIQDMIDNGFPSSVNNLSSSLSCFRKKGEGGRFVVFLIGINNSGTYGYIPVGLVAIDNVKPIVNDYGSGFKYIHDCGLFLRKVPWGLPDVEETVTISNGQFRGNDALFEVEFDEGIESISIKREIYHDYMRYSYRPETKTIKLSDKESPYYFRYILDLFIGDNYIPITVTDKFGNSTNYTYKITMEQIKEDD